MSVASDPTADESSDIVSSSGRSRPKRWAGVEGGGTTWVVAIAEGTPDRVVSRQAFPTRSPEETLPRIASWLAAAHAESPFHALGVATFGPVDLDKQSPTYGYITHSPKPGWEAVDVLGLVKEGWCPKNMPTGFDTDVNAPAVAEYAAVVREFAAMDDLKGKPQATGRFVKSLWEDDGDDDTENDGDEGDAFDDGAAQSLEGARRRQKNDNAHLRFQNLAYITVGTGVGVGLVCGGEPVHGLSHPEAGHCRVARLLSDGLFGSAGSFVGTCPFHEDCIEGMAGASAIAKRCGCSMNELSRVPDDHPAWDAAAHYVAGLCATLVMVVSPQRIVLGGGVLQRKTLVNKIRISLRKQLGGYVRHDFVERADGLKQFLVHSRHGKYFPITTFRRLIAHTKLTFLFLHSGNDAGIVGALALAERARSAAEPFFKKKKSLTRRLAHYFGFGIVSAMVTLKIVNGEVRVRGRRLV
jgi:fructokinase